MRDELARRATLRDRVRETFLARPNIWISMLELSQIGGIGGWRTRVSEVRQVDGLNIQQQGNGARSKYRYVPAATSPAQQPGLFEEA